MANSKMKSDNKALHDLIKTILSECGFKCGTDYTLSVSQLYFKVDMNHVKKSRIMNALEHNFPQFCFEWETSYKLTWF